MTRSAGCSQLLLQHLPKLYVASENRMESISQFGRQVIKSRSLKRAFIAAPIAICAFRQASPLVSTLRTMASAAAHDLPEDTKPSLSAATKDDQTLPALSASDFRAYNRMADRMNLFHNHFRNTWNTMYSACDPSSPTANSLSATKLVNMGQEFVHHLEGHHSIEEQYVFPMLAQRMPMFQADAMAGPLEQHRQIHRGMDELEAYLGACKTGERSLRREEVKKIMDGFGGVLWTHLDEEVQYLGAESMRKYWKKEEIARMPI